MEDSTSSSTTKEAGSFHEVIRAILKCLGLETEFPSPCSKKEDEDEDGKLNHDQLHSPEQTSDPPTDRPPDPPSTTGDDGGSDRSFSVTSRSTPKRPGTARGRGGQIN